MMKVVVVLSEAGCNLDLALGLLRLSTQVRKYDDV